MKSVNLMAKALISVALFSSSLVFCAQTPKAVVEKPKDAQTQTEQKISAEERQKIVAEALAALKNAQTAELTAVEREKIAAVIQEFNEQKDEVAKPGFAKKWGKRFLIGSGSILAVLALINCSETAREVYFRILLWIFKN